ncbi:MAG: ribosome biogenesis GTP-binding protein YihA/YsxC [Bryobacterales bacterium]|nr:ribosome biogenesis GTP-binding protein YihA/YsxC [Bryobacterales bacterium]
MKTEFIVGATSPAQFPRDPKPEVAFLGRSNVGKSSLLNALVGNQKVAFTSSRPGCTQQINFFDTEGRIRLVDLPGYGYAKAPKALREEWSGLIETYLGERECLRLCICILDIRRGWMESDRTLREWLDFKQRPYLVVATKIDKLRNIREVKREMTLIQEEVPGRDVIAFSARKGQGVKELWQAIWKIKSNP